MTVFHVDSEVGRLRQVILHRPGLELSRLTPRNVDALLFDDILWAKRAREEHDAFAQALRDQGVRVHYFADLLAEVLDMAEARTWLLDRIITPGAVGPALAEPIRHLCADLDGETLAGYLIGGLLKDDLPLTTPNSLFWSALGEEDFALTPLPNHLFPRDNSCWIYDRLSVNPMAKPARRRESLHAAAVYRCHPLFAESATAPILEGPRHPAVRAPWKAVTSTSSATARSWSAWVNAPPPKPSRPSPPASSPRARPSACWRSSSPPHGRTCTWTPS